MPESLMAKLLQQSLDPNDPLTDPVTGELIVRLLNRAIAQNEKILEEHTALKAALTGHVIGEEVLLKGLHAAFPKKPDGSPDYEGHEAFHTALIDEARERSAFFRGLRYKLLEKGFWGLMTVLGLLIAYWWSGQVRH